MEGTKLPSTYLLTDLIMLWLSYHISGYLECNIHLKFECMKSATAVLKSVESKSKSVQNFNIY